MEITWCVIAFETDGSRIIIDEELTEDRANYIRELMESKGHRTIIEADVPYQWN